MNWRAILPAIGRVLLPLRCVLCQGAGADGLDLCALCRAELPWNSAACERCGLPLAPGMEATCGLCRLAPPPYRRVQCPLRYRFPVDRLVPRFKFHGDLAAGAVLATLMHWALDPTEAPQALVPVPLHRQRLRQRGYDQALELARLLSRQGRVPVRADVLKRVRATAPQTRLHARERRGNLCGAFALRAGHGLPAHVALVDDVLTTGATVAECARVLLAGGVQRVDVWTIARA